MVALVIVALVVLGVVAGLLAVARRRTGGANGALPIPDPFPIWSDMIIDVTRTGGFPDMVKLHAQHGPIFWWRLLGRRMLMVGGLEAEKKVLNAENVLVKADYPTSVKKMLGPWGMVNIAGKQHVRLKRLAQAAFTPKAIRGYLPRMQAFAEQAVAKWAADGDVLLYQELKWFTFRIIVEIMVGLDDEHWTSAQNFPAVSAEFATWLEGLFSFPVPIPGTAFARGMKAKDAIMKRIHASLDLLEAQQAQHGSPAAAHGAVQEGREGASQPTIMELMMASRDSDDQQGLTRDQLADTVLTLLFAGHDTSSTTLTRIFQFLHRHPEAVQRLRQEQAEVVAKHGTALTEAALDEMRYADGVIREVMRITPIIGGFPRIALQDFDLCGHRILKGTRMQCSLAQVLLTDERWQNEDDPLAFKPERWMSGAGLKQGAWIPFGGGPRLCLGWLLAMVEMKVLLATVFRGHAVQLQQPDEPWILFPLARPKNGMPVRFTAVEQE